MRNENVYYRMILHLHLWLEKSCKILGTGNSQLGAMPSFSDSDAASLKGHFHSE